MCFFVVVDLFGFFLEFTVLSEEKERVFPVGSIVWYRAEWPQSNTTANLLF